MANFLNLKIRGQNMFSACARESLPLQALMVNFLSILFIKCFPVPKQ